MSLHDAYARLTPYEIAFPDPEAIERLAADVDEEATSRGVDASLLDVFVTLGSVDDFVRALQPPDATSSAMSQYGALVYHATWFARAGRPLYLARTEVVRRLVEDAPAGDPAPPEPAGYVQLPQHLVWMDVGDAGPESVDGVFWVANGVGELHALPVTGVLPERPGFRALPLPAAPLADAAIWLHEDMRGSDGDFTSTLPGHELDRLLAVRTTGEVLKLLARFFSYLSYPATESEAAARRAAGPRAPSDAAPERGPRPSALPYRLVELVG